MGTGGASGMMILRLRFQPRAQMRRLFLFGGQRGAQCGEFLVFVPLKLFQRLALLAAIHGVALHQDVEIHQ